MRHNRRRPIRTSTMAPNQVSLRKDSAPVVRCPICGAWRLVERSMVRAHRASDGRTRCPGSGQRLIIDETPEELAGRLWLANATAGRL